MIASWCWTPTSIINLELWLILQSYVFLSNNASVEKTFTKPHVLIGKTTNSSSGINLTILSKPFYWSIVVCLLIDVLWIVPPTILLIVYQIISMIVPTVLDHSQTTLNVVPLVPVLLLQVSFLNINMVFLPELLTLSRLIHNEILLPIKSAA